MKLLIVAAVVLMAVVGSSDGLKCFTCGEEDSDKCQDGQTSKECPAEEAGAVSSINCYATEIFEGETRTVMKGCLPNPKTRQIALPKAVEMVKLKGCIEITEAEIRGVFCVCPEDDCNEVEPIALDDCNSSAGSLAKSLLVTLTASAAALSFLML